MDRLYQPAQPDAQQPPPYGGYSTASQQRGQPELLPPSWAPPPACDGHLYRYDYPTGHPGGACFGAARFPPPFGFDPSVPPPPFGCPPPGHYPPPAPVSSFSQPFSAEPRPGPPRYDPEPNPGRSHRQHEDYRDGGVFHGGPAPPPPLPPSPLQSRVTRPEDEGTLQRRQDQQWISRFLQSRVRTTGSPQSPQQSSKLPGAPSLREALYGAAQLVSQLEELCHTLKHNLEDQSVWTDSYSAALHVKKELQDRVSMLSDPKCASQLRAKLSRIAQRRARRLRAKKQLQMEEELAEERSAEKEAAIDEWRLRQIQQVEEKKKEQELKLAADAVLSEVRKKQADVKRMQDVLRSLEKLRRLRKEAASRKGIVTEQQCDELFSSRLEQLRTVMKRRTVVYLAEEKALMVMLEGEQEEERRREQERKAKKERERELQRKCRVNAMLFGDELPADGALQPFREYYNQAEHSLQALLQIRREWDVFLVAADNPDGSSVPHNWILPDPPADRAWASALQASEADCQSV